MQVAVPATAPAARVHGLPVKAPGPTGATVKATVPVGVVGVAKVSVTVAVQVTRLSTTMEAEAHARLVIMVCGVTVRAKGGFGPELTLWVESPE